MTVDQAHSVVHFADSTHTGQVNLTMAAASGQVDAYLHQQSTSLGITSPKTAPAVSFANSSWQIVQGTDTQSGATYTIVLYVTQHNSHFYMLEFQAPQVAFARTDRSNFEHMRSTFSFLP